VVASEAITVGNTTVKLPGIGSWLAVAIEQKDIRAVVLAVGTMAVTILAYDQLVVRPIVAPADKFRVEQTAAPQRPRSWVYDLMRRTQLIDRLFAAIASALARIAIPWPRGRHAKARRAPAWLGRTGDALWLGLVLLASAYALWRIGEYVYGLGTHEI